MRSEIAAVHGAFISEVLAYIRVLEPRLPAVFRPILAYHFRPLEQTKGFRPALLKALHDLRVQQGGKPVPRPELVRRAACLHLLHESSLIIDDVLDHDVMRRGQRAVHCLYGRIPATAAAGWVCTHVAEEFVEQPELMRAVLQMSVEIMVAETVQWQARLYERPLDTAVWRQIALGDTGALLRLAARLAGLEPREYHHVLDALTYLYHGGDDIQDLEDAAADDGFAGGGNADLRDHIPTLMTCFTASKDEGALRAALPAAKHWLRQFQAVDRPPVLDVFFDVLAL